MQHHGVSPLQDKVQMIDVPLHHLQEFSPFPQGNGFHSPYTGCQLFQAEQIHSHPPHLPASVALHCGSCSLVCAATRQLHIVTSRLCRVCSLWAQEAFNKTSTVNVTCQRSLSFVIKRTDLARPCNRSLL